MRTKKYSTSTILNDNNLVPWASANGPLFYSPSNPPDRDYFFQYTWIVPKVFNEKVNKRQHRWFGGPFKDTFGTRTLFDFWNNARKGNTTSVYQALGDTSISSLKAPVAVYKHEEKAILIRHLSYQIIKLNEQPF